MFFHMISEMYYIPYTHFEKIYIFKFIRLLPPSTISNVYYEIVSVQFYFQLSARNNEILFKTVT